uniref:prostaglandin-endoperoxide synthase n=1 Tax=Meiomenia swedmarki TaxID=1500384 RepID=A0A0U2KWR5_9MOLL|nr:cyclooxygenase [Meiomenia swedmarki]
MDHLRIHLLFFCLIVVMVETTIASKASTDPVFHPCCGFPCQNRGVCTSRGFSDYECDCTDTGYYGRDCEQATLKQSIVNFLRPSKSTVHNLITNYKWLWDIINATPFIHSFLLKQIYLDRASLVDRPIVYTSAHEYTTLEAAFNTSYYSRVLPPVHKNCPTPMGVVGKKDLPKVDDLIERLLRRRTFVPDELNHSVMLAFFAQHFTHQFFKTNYTLGPGYTYGRHGVDLGNLYGSTVDTENKLRSFENGRLKSQIINGEEYPPYLKDAPVKMRYPPNTPEDQKFAMGHEFYSLIPGLFMYATVWLREHNRVARVMADVHPDWDEEQLFQTTKLIVVGETINVVISDYVQTLSNYHARVLWKPEILFGTEYQYNNRISVEFNHLYHWHPMMPDQLHIGDTTYQIEETFFHPEIVIKHGVAEMAAAFTKQLSGSVTLRNHPNSTLPVVSKLIKDGRELRLQPFNQYRKRFKLKPYQSFEDLTGNKEIADILEDMYGDIDAVEFYVGLLMEKHRKRTKFGQTMLEMGAGFSVTGLLSNPICSRKYWKPSTFGGEVGFNIVKSATSLQELFCRNIQGDCPTISFTVPKKYTNECKEENCSKTEL